RHGAGGGVLRVDEGADGAEGLPHVLGSDDGRRRGRDVYCRAGEPAEHPPSARAGTGDCVSVIRNADFGMRNEEKTIFGEQQWLPKSASVSVLQYAFRNPHSEMGWRSSAVASPRRSATATARSRCCAASISKCGSAN